MRVDDQRKAWELTLRIDDENGSQCPSKAHRITQDAIAPGRLTKVQELVGAGQLPGVWLEDDAHRLGHWRYVVQPALMKTTT